MVGNAESCGSGWLQWVKLAVLMAIAGLAIVLAIIRQGPSDNTKPQQNTQTRSPDAVQVGNVTIDRFSEADLEGCLRVYNQSIKEARWKLPMTMKTFRAGLMELPAPLADFESFSPEDIIVALSGGAVVGYAHLGKLHEEGKERTLGYIRDVRCNEEDTDLARALIREGAIRLRDRLGTVEIRALEHIGGCAFLRGGDPSGACWPDQSWLRPVFTDLGFVMKKTDFFRLGAKIARPEPALQLPEGLSYQSKDVTGHIYSGTGAKVSVVNSQGEEQGHISYWFADELEEKTGEKTCVIDSFECTTGDKYSDDPKMTRVMRPLMQKVLTEMYEKGYRYALSGDEWGPLWEEFEWDMVETGSSFILVAERKISVAEPRD